MYKVEVVFYNGLTKQEKEDFSLPDNGPGKEFANYLRISHDGVLRLESDAMEPEDVSFRRDLSWIAEALQEAYKLGASDYKKQILKKIDGTSIDII